MLVRQVGPFGGRGGGVWGRGNPLGDGEAVGVVGGGVAGERVGGFGEELDEVQVVGGAGAAGVGCYGELGGLGVQAGHW